MHQALVARIMAENRQEQGGAQPPRRRQRRRERRARAPRDAAVVVDPIDQNGVPALPALANDLLGHRPRGTRRERSFLGHLFVEERQPATEDSPAKISRTLYVHYEMPDATLLWFQDNIVHQPVEVARPVPEHCAGHPHPAIATLRKMLTAAYGNACAGRAILIVGGSLVRTAQALAHSSGRPTRWSVHHPPWQSESKYSPTEDRQWWTQHHVNPPPEVDAIDHHEWDSVIYDCNWWDMPQELWDQILRDVDSGCRIYMLATEVDIRREGVVFGGEVSWRNRMLTYGTEAPTPWGVVARGTNTVTTPFGPARVTPFVRLGSVVYAHGIYRLHGPGEAPRERPLPLDLQDDWRMYTWTAPREWSPLGFPIVWGKETRNALLPSRVVNDACATALRANTQDRHWLTALRNYVDEKLRARKTDDHHLVCENIVSYAQAQRRIVTANAAQHYEQSDVRKAEDRLFEGRVLDWRIVAMWAVLAVGAVGVIWYTKRRFASFGARIMGRVRPGAIIVARHPKWDEASAAMPYRAIGAVCHRPVAYHDSCWGIQNAWINHSTHMGAIPPSPPYGEACRPNARLVQCGPSIATVIPTVCRACVHNEFAAIVCRVTEARLDADTSDWQHLARAMDWKPLVCKPQRRHAWLQRFPRGKRESLINTVLQYGWRPDLWRAAHQVRLMVKIEKMLKPRDEEGVAEPYTARAIVFMPEKFQVATGPWSVGLDKRLACEWDGNPRHGRRLLYASGRDGVGYGAWWTQAVANPERYAIAICGDNCYILALLDGRLCAFEVDLVHCDSAQGIPQLSVKCAMYRRLGAPGYYCSAQMARIFKQGWSRHGLWFQAVGVTDTGNNDTKLGNSLLVGVCMDRIVDKAQRTTSTPMAFAACVEESATQYGYPITLKTDDIDQTPFCSALWVPTEAGVTLTQMPGRWLAKSGYTVHCQNPAKSEEWLRGAMLPAVRDFNHIPAIRRLANHLVTITHGRSRTYRGEREWQWHVGTPQNPDVGRLNEWWLRRYGHEYHEFSNAIDWLIEHTTTPVVTYWHPVLAAVVGRDTLLPADWIDEILSQPHDPNFTRDNALQAVAEVTHLWAPVLEESVKTLGAQVLAVFRVPWRFARIIACSAFGAFEWWGRRTCSLEHTLPALQMHVITGLYDQGGATTLHLIFNQCARLSIQNPVMGGIARLILQVAFVWGLAQNMLPTRGVPIAEASLVGPRYGRLTPEPKCDFDAVAFVYRVRCAARRSASTHTNCEYRGRSNTKPGMNQNGQQRRRRRRRQRPTEAKVEVRVEQPRQAAPNVARRSRRARRVNRGNALNATNVQTTYFRVGGRSGGGIVVRGREVVQQLFVSSVPEKQHRGFINPMSMSLPKLAGSAQSWERFEFERLDLLYETTCAKTVSGFVMAAIQQNPTDPDPSNVIEYYDYATGFVTSVGANKRARAQLVRRSEGYFTTISSGDQSAADFTDPTTRFQGKYSVATGGSVSADSGTAAGLLVLEYVCHLWGERPSRDSVLTLTTPRAGAFSQTGTNVAWRALANSIGSWGWENSTALRPGFSTIKTEESWVSSAGDYAIGYLLDWAGAAAQGVSPRRTVSATYGVAARKWGAIVRGVVPVGTTISLRARNEAEAKEVVIYGRTRLGEGRAYVTLDVPLEGRLEGAHWQTMELVPNAAGDITITVDSVAENDPTSVQTLNSTTFSLGTGAVVTSLSDFATQLLDGISRVKVVLATGETRTLDTTAANFVTLNPTIAVAE